MSLRELSDDIITSLHCPEAIGTRNQVLIVAMRLEYEYQALHSYASCQTSKYRESSSINQIAIGMSRYPHLQPMSNATAMSLLADMVLVLVPFKTPIFLHTAIFSDSQSRISE